VGDRRSLLERVREFLSPGPDSTDELIETLADAEERELIDPESRAMLEGVIRMADLTAGDAMVAAPRMDLLDIAAPYDELLALVIETGHSRFPVYEGDHENLIGILLAGVAGLLAWQSRGLLIGEGIRPETARALRDIALAQPGVRDVGRVLSMYVGPDDALVTIDLDFDAGTETADAALAMAEVERRVRERFPMIKRLFIESGSAAVPQRWSRPDAIRPPPEAMATPASAVEAPTAP